MIAFEITIYLCPYELDASIYIYDTAMPLTMNKAHVISYNIKICLIARKSGGSKITPPPVTATVNNAIKTSGSRIKDVTVC